MKEGMDMYSEDFEKAAKWACSQLTDTEHAQVMEAWGERRPIPYAIQGKLSDLMDEYGWDNDLEDGWWYEYGGFELIYNIGTDEQSELTDKQKASELLSFMEDEWDGKAIINALNQYLKDSDLASLYDQLVKDNVIRQ